MKIGLFYGSTAGTTEEAAENIKKAFDAIIPDLVDLYDIGKHDMELMMEYELLIVGCPTYNIGELQDDWFIIYDKLPMISLAGCKVAMYGLGDQYGYGQTFADAIGILGKRFRDDCGADLVGYFPTEGFDFVESVGLENGQFMGLPLDEDNQASLSEGRIKQWVAQLIQEFELTPVNS